MKNFEKLKLTPISQGKIREMHTLSPNSQNYPSFKKLQIKGFQDIMNRGAENFLYNKKFLGRRSLLQIKKSSIDRSIIQKFRRKSCACQKCGKLTSKEIKFYHLHFQVKLNKNRNLLEKDSSKKLIKINTQTQLTQNKGKNNFRKFLGNSKIREKNLKIKFENKNIKIQTTHSKEKIQNCLTLLPLNEIINSPKSNMKHNYIGQISNKNSQTTKFTSNKCAYFSPSPASSKVNISKEKIQFISKVQQSVKLPQILKNKFQYQKKQNQQQNIIKIYHKQKNGQKKQKQNLEKYFIKIYSPKESFTTKDPESSNTLNKTSFIDKSNRSLSPLSEFQKKIPTFNFGVIRDKLNMYF